MVSYKYDSYGNIKQISGDLSLGKLNPFRYKGYYYDNESGMYYCKSRYYVAYWRRWLNMDRIEYLDNTNIGNIIYIMIIMTFVLCVIWKMIPVKKIILIVIVELILFFK